MSRFRIFDDEAVTVKIDVRRDRRTTLGFAVNLAGQVLDYIAVDNGQIFRRSDLFFVHRERRVYEGDQPIERSLWLKLAFRVDALL